MSLFDGLLGNDGDRNDGGLLKNPLEGIPGISNLFPRPTDESSTSIATSSVQQPIQTPGLSLTLLSGTSSSTTSESSLSLPTSASTTSSDTNSATATDTTSAPETPATDSATLTPPPSDTGALTPTLPPAAPSPSTTSSSTSSSPSESPTAAAATAPQGFLANKPLSISVITAASLVGLILLIVIATWAVRKRRHDRLHKDILDFSNASLVGGHDPEKGSGVAEADSNAGHGSVSSTEHGTLPPVVQPRQMYQDNYAQPIYAPKPPPSRNANPYGVQPAYGASAYNGYQQNNTYDNWGYGYGNMGASSQVAYNQQAYGGMDDVYGGIVDSGAMAGVGAGAQNNNPPQRRPSAHRKAPPPLNITPTNPIAQPTSASSPISAASLNNLPLQPSQAPLVLPDQFGAKPAGEPRRLMVRNE